MQKTIGALTVAALALPLALPLAAGTAFAADPMSSDVRIACSEVRYSSEFLTKVSGRARVYLNSKDRTTVLQGSTEESWSVLPPQ